MADRDIAAGCCGIETTCASLPTQSPSQPAHPPGEPGFWTFKTYKGGVPARDGLSDGAEWIRTFSSALVLWIKHMIQRRPARHHGLPWTSVAASESSDWIDIGASESHRNRNLASASKLALLAICIRSAA